MRLQGKVALITGAQEIQTVFCHSTVGHAPHGLRRLRPTPRRRRASGESALQRAAAGRLGLLGVPPGRTGLVTGSGRSCCEQWGSGGAVRDCSNA